MFASTCFFSKLCVFFFVENCIHADICGQPHLSGVNLDWILALLVLCFFCI